MVSYRDAIYSTARHAFPHRREDRIYGTHGKFLVLDGTKRFVAPTEDRFLHPICIDTSSFVDHLMLVFMQNVDMELLFDTVVEMNENVASLVGKDLLDRPEYRPSASFGAVSIHDGGLEIVQGGDTIVFIRYRSGHVWATPNLVHPHTVELRARRAGIDEHSPEWDQSALDIVLEIQSRTNTKDGWVGLNGQRYAVNNMCFRWIKEYETIRDILVLTDGFLPFSLAADTKKLARQMFNKLDEGGIPQIQAWQESIDMNDHETANPYLPEGTALHIQVLHD